MNLSPWRGYLWAVLPALAIGLGLGCALVVPAFEQKLSAIVIFVVPVALGVQAVLFFRLTQLLARIEGRVALSGPVLDGVSASPPAAAPAPPAPTPAPAPAPTAVTRPLPAAPIAGSSRNPPPAKHPAPASTGRGPAAPSPLPLAAAEEPEYEDPAANRQGMLALMEQFDRGEAPASPERPPPASGSAPPPAEPRGEAKAAELDAQAVVQVWNHYLIHGNGHFEAKGLEAALAAAGIRATVLPPEDLIGLGAPVLGVAAPGSRERVILLPDFNRPPRAVAQWYDLDPDTTRMKRLVRAAELQMDGAGYKVRPRGFLE